ncbi:MAG: TMEM165/GDT1 family protein [Gammaproteobacteria bacterium]|nr:TMEM165/GDT1 family protein [Gammaproteobacteria bacterium]MBU2056771.1 TMEM165/GDT1 family protein [Gammaproteobacteria bacterium]MBU2174108.1 TMEM165/GDT1 family protein [Gammaproteobacteria bacterium]MBU2246986.1 TMEM165/GDT1 family protein [Gammaproteobacteria bacterium]MBU2343412.1 TMEM165/GDT1 family protein [Gammaproteobacteria bacterium]
MFFDAFVASFASVAVAEIGDKTQLLSLFLAARFRSRGAIIAGILVATLLNHAASAWFGAWVAQFIPEGWHAWLLGGSFIAVALWLLIPDKDESEEVSVLKYGAFFASCILFFLAEIGDKTQVATVLLAATYPQTWQVILGTTIGMLAANVPVVYAGSWLLERISLDWARRVACAIFMLLGVLAILMY